MVKYLITFLLVISNGHCSAQALFDYLKNTSAGPDQHTTSEEIAKYKQLAAAGNIRAMGYLGDMYWYGEATVLKDCEQSLKYLKMAIAVGDSSSMMSHAVQYLKGECVERDYSKAWDLLQQAAQKKVSAAMLMLGVMSEAGMGRAANYNTAQEWYFKTAENPVEIFYGSGRREGAGFLVLDLLVEQARTLYHIDSFKQFHSIDTLKTFLAFQSAAEKGNKYAMMALGSAYLSGACTVRDTTKGMSWLRKSANAGNARAMYELAVYYNPRGDNYDGPHDEALAARWFLKSAEGGYIDGMTSIAIVYYHGRGVKQDYKKANEWFLKAATKGDALAMNDLGLVYMNGVGVTKDTMKAAEWFQKAAAQDYPNSMFSLGYFYENGYGGLAKDYNKAMEWYLKAANYGNQYAIDAIGKLYEDGKGVPQDLKKAVEWYSKRRH